jgi:PIN domain nuclease of toxin-antitoxin system
MSDLLLDTHVMLAVIDPDNFAVPRALSSALATEDHTLFVSGVSLWELAIKHRLGKLPLRIALDDWPTALALAEIEIIDISTMHIIAELDPLPSTKDPFDRLLLAIAQVEGINLVTVDKAMRDHPLAWRP